LPTVLISEFLFKKIHKKFGTQESEKIIDFLESVEQNPNKGKILTSVKGILVKELKYKNFRFYFLTDGKILKFGTQEELLNLIIKFVNMSDKKDQQKVINEIKKLIENLSFDDFK
jgi:hypothetical protein